MKKILYIGPKFFGYENIITNLIKENLNCEVIYLDVDSIKIEYKNLYERLLNNLYYKKIKKQDLKELKKDEKLIKKIKKIEKEIDIIFYIRPLIERERFLKYLNSLGKKMICHHWDSMSTMIEPLKCLGYFDKKSTFDMEEAKKYKLDFIPNFYYKFDFIKEKIEKEEEYKIFTVLSYDEKRFEFLRKIASVLNEKKVKYLFLIYDKTGKLKEENWFKLLKLPITLEENYYYMLKSKIILEIGHIGKQGGLSFRAIDSLGLEKKLITNYNFIKQYDFYNKENIEIIDEENIIISDTFLKTDYKKIEKSIYEKYTGKNWIKKIFS